LQKLYDMRLATFKRETEIGGETKDDTMLFDIGDARSTTVYVVPAAESCWHCAKGR